MMKCKPAQPAGGAAEREGWPARGRPADEPPHALALSIVAESQILCEGLAGLLPSLLEAQVVGWYGASAPVIACAPHRADHIVLIDAGMGPSPVLAWIRRWRAEHTAVKTVVFDTVCGPELIVDYIAAGAAAYLPRGASAQELVATIETVRCGHAHCPPELAGPLFARLSELGGAADRPPTGPRLTGRELEVLDCLAQDYSNRQIAAALMIEVRTVKHHVHNILEKLQLRHRWDAARFALQQGWLSAEGADKRRPTAEKAAEIGGAP